MKATAILLALAALSAQGALASGHTGGSSSDPLDTRIYKNGIWVGGGANWSSLDPDGGDDDDDFGFNLGVGYQFLNYFGVNVRYKDLGEFDAGGNIDLEVDGFTGGFNAGYPITQRVGVIGGVGYFDFDVDGGSAGDGSEDGLYLSGGIVSQIGRVIVQPELIWYDTDDADLFGLEVNFFWKFELGN